MEGQIVIATVLVLVIAIVIKTEIVAMIVTAVATGNVLVTVLNHWTLPSARHRVFHTAICTATARISLLLQLQCLDFIGSPAHLSGRFGV